MTYFLLPKMQKNTKKTNLTVTGSNFYCCPDLDAGVK